MRRLGEILAFAAFCSIAVAQNPATAVFPTAVATDQNLTTICNSGHSQVSVAVAPTDTTITLSSAASFCTPSYVTLDGGTGSSEVVKACSQAGNVLTLCSGGRAVHGTATTHGVGA